MNPRIMAEKAAQRDLISDSILTGVPLDFWGIEPIIQRGAFACKEKDGKKGPPGSRWSGN
jgi:hypothetical protein